MDLLRSSIRTLFIRESVKSPGAPPDNPVAVRPVSGLPAARIRRVKRSRFAAMARALLAVKASTPEVDFLRTRLATYQATTPRDLVAPVPKTEINDAAVFVIHDADRRHPLDLLFETPADGDAPHATVAAEAAFQRAAFEAAGAAIARRASEIEEDLQTAERELREANDELDRLAAEGTSVADTRRHAIEGGRIDLAPLRFPSLPRILLWRAWLVTSLVAEWACFFFALANANGVDPTALDTEWVAGGAWAIIGSALAALTVAGGAFILAEWASTRLHASITDEAAPGRGFRFWTALSTMGFVAAVLMTVAVMRAQLGTAGQTDSAAFLRYAILTAAPLVAAVCASAHARDLEARRAAALTLIGTPDRYSVAAELRKAEEQRWIAERERLRIVRRDLISALQRLQASVAGGDQALRDVARFETYVVSSWLDAVTAAMARDKALFRGWARLLGREQLLATQPAAAGVLVPLRRTRRTA